MPRGTKSFNKQKNGDDHKVLPIMQHLTSLGYHCFREPTISSGMFKNATARKPDIMVRYGKHFEVFIEVDGKVHGHFEMPTKNTIKRNVDYEAAHYNYIILSEEDAKFHGLDIKGLAGYMVGEAYTKFLAKLENGSMYL